MNTPHLTLPDLGWSNHFLSQLDLEEFETGTPARVTGVHRSLLDVLTTDGERRVALTPALAEGQPAVGDWLIIDATDHARLLDRKTVLTRRAAGSNPIPQPIAANIDTALITTSCNADFNPARLERYLALALQEGVTPVVVLTKADLADDPDDYRQRAEALHPGLFVETLNALDAEDTATRLSPWTGKGQTIVLMGSSGVGKTTIANALTGTIHATQDIREDDAKGRHTTTSRAMFRLSAGGWLIDTPGMRELRLMDAADGIDAVFDDLNELAATCRFSDCAHDTEPGCAIQAAIAAGDLDPARLTRWQKLQREDQFNSETVAERHARARTLGKMYRVGKARSSAKRGGPG